MSSKLRSRSKSKTRRRVKSKSGSKTSAIKSGSKTSAVKSRSKSRAKMGGKITKSGNENKEDIKTIVKLKLITD